MTSTQYLLGWVVYILGATGCILAFWLIIRKLPVRLIRSMTLALAALLYTPWWLTSESQYFVPAVFVMTYDALTFGFEAMARSGTAVVASVGIAALIGIIMPVRAEAKKTTKNNTNASSHRKTQRKEPIC